MPRPLRLPLEATLAFNPGQKAICVGLYETDICAEDLSMVWLTVSAFVLLFLVEVFQDICSSL